MDVGTVFIEQHYEPGRGGESVGPPPSMPLFVHCRGVPERLSRKERQDVYMLVGFVGLLLATVLVVVLIRDQWTQLGWTALAAVAASVQALGVIGALVFAWAQIKSAKAESRRRRRDQLIDELATATYRGLTPAVQQFNSAWRSAVYYRRMSADLPIGTDLHREYTEAYQRSRARVGEAYSMLQAAVEEASLVMLRLGEDGKVVFALLQLAALERPVHLLPVNARQPLTDTDDEHLSDAMTDFERWVHQFIREHVTSE